MNLFRISLWFMNGLVVAHLLLISGCTRGVTISMDDKVPPTFTFARSFGETNYLPMFYVSEVRSENLNIPYTKQPLENRMIWQIEPLTGSDGEIKILPPIAYGRVPKGFTQNLPEHSDPPSLEEGKVYEAGGPANLMPNGFTRFTIRNGKAVRLSVPGQHP